MTRDPVCDQEVDEAQARLAGLTATYARRSFCFCSVRCKQQFEEHPQWFMVVPRVDGYVERVWPWPQH